jgi:hypothetical protein
VDSSSLHCRIAGPRSCRPRAAVHAAACIALAIATTAAAQDVDADSAAPASPLPSASALASVHGVVRNAVTGEPLARALVRIEGDASTGALTDGDGRFEIPDLPPGPQIFEVVKPGYMDKPPNAGGRMAMDLAGSAHNVIVSAGMPDLAFSLTPTNAIRGQVGLSTGDPAEGIEVQLLRRTVQDGRGVWQTMTATKALSDGSYRFAGLPNGDYALYTNPAMDSEEASNVVAAGRARDVVRDGYASQFFPDARDLAGAAKIHLANGEEAQANINLTLEPFHAVTAIATFPDDRAGSASADRDGMNFSAVVMDPQGHQLPYSAQYDPATRTIQALLPDGTYSLQLTATARFLLRVLPGGTVRATSPNSWPYVGSVDFSVAGRAISNLRVPLSIPAPSSVRLTVLHSASAASTTPQSTLNARPEAVVMASEAGGWMSDGATNSFAEGGEGRMDAEYTAPGSYWMHTRMTQAGLCEVSFTAGGANLAREPLVVGLSGATAPMELTAEDDCAKLTLTLPAALSGLSVGEEPFYTVYAVPDFDSTADVEPVTLRPTSGGSMTLDGLTPGSYRVYTFSGPVELEYRNRDALAALPDPGQQVTLSPGQTSSLVLEAPAQ